MASQEYEGCVEEPINIKAVTMRCSLNLLVPYCSSALSFRHKQKVQESHPSHRHNEVLSLLPPCALRRQRSRPARACSGRSRARPEMCCQPAQLCREHVRRRRQLPLLRPKEAVRQLEMRMGWPALHRMWLSSAGISNLNPWSSKFSYTRSKTDMCSGSFMLITLSLPYS